MAICAVSYYWLPSLSILTIIDLFFWGFGFMVGNCFLCCHGNTTILIAEMTQITNKKVISLMVVFFLKIIKLWHLSIEFYGVWQKVAIHHRTQYLKVLIQMHLHARTECKLHFVKMRPPAA